MQVEEAGLSTPSNSESDEESEKRTALSRLRGSVYPIGVLGAVVYWCNAF